MRAELIQTSAQTTVGVDIDSLRTEILTKRPSDIVSEYVLERIPHIFGGDWTLYRHWRRKLGEALGVDPCNICITGSACVGVSLNPHKNLSPFRPKSDIDVAIISSYHFEIAWKTLRHLRLADAATPIERQALTDQQTYVYWGTIATDKIARFLPFGSAWTVGLSQMKIEKPTEGRELKFRIYRDYDALRAYQIRSVQAIRAALLEISQ